MKRLNSYDYEYAQLEELKSAAVFILTALIGFALGIGALVYWILSKVAALWPF